MKKLIAVSLLLSVVGCSWLTDDEGVFRDRKKDYRKSEATDRMQIPAGLDSSAIIDYHVIPELSPFADPSMIEELPLPPEKVADREGSVTIQSMGSKQWILVNAIPSRVWPHLKQFLAAEQLELQLENGSIGILEAADGSGVYRFKLEQGFQRKATELSIRHLSSAAQSQDFWPEASQDSQLEQKMVERAAQYLADTESDAVYSFAAQSVSTTPKMRIALIGKAQQAMVLRVSEARARASLERALNKAGFEAQSEQQGYLVKYLPPLPEDKKPGWFKRMFGVKARAYDDDVEYAGNSYRVSFQKINDGYQVAFEVADSDEQLSDRQRNKQLNQMLDVLKGTIN